METDAGRPKPLTGFAVFVVELIRPVDAVADLLPVDQVPTVENGQSRIVDKG